MRGRSSRSNPEQLILPSLAMNEIERPNLHSESSAHIFQVAPSHTPAEEQGDWGRRWATFSRHFHARHFLTSVRLLPLRTSASHAFALSQGHAIPLPRTCVFAPPTCSFEGLRISNMITSWPTSNLKTRLPEYHVTRSDSSMFFQWKIPQCEYCSLLKSQSDAHVPCV